ncbi:MAG: histidine--tRNA ligase [Desulfobacterales bacterium]
MIQLIRGFKDILPGESERWQHIERTATTLFRNFGYREIRIPIMEHTELFARSIGENTDIVEKEMYTFPDRKGQLLTLRPEATASVVRAYIQHKLYAQDPVQKVYVIGPMFRRERPQKGRYRQFYQIDAEVFGVAEPYVDAQLIHMLVTLFERLEVPDVHVVLNSLGCPECRPAFREALSGLLETVSDRLCSDCRRRQTQNPLRVLDCKVPACQEAMVDAPAMVDHLCPACRVHFEEVQETLTLAAIPFRINPRLVRGLDYYTRTAFELQTGSLGAQSAVCGGGRYDGLVKTLGGPEIPAIGFAIGFDRLVEIAQLGGRDFSDGPQLFIASLGRAGRRTAGQWALALGADGVKVEMEMTGRSLKAQMKRANRLQAAHVLILGDDELEKGAVVLRDMSTSEQTEIPLAKALERLTTRFASESR